MPKSLHSFISSLAYIDFESLVVADVVVIVISQSMLAQRIYNCIPALIQITSPTFLPMQWSIYFCMIVL